MVNIKKTLYSVDEVTEMIENGSKLILAADETMLDKLPKGNWIGGTIPYFLGDNGGEYSTEKIYVDDISNQCLDISVKTYSEENLKNMISDRYDNGYSFIILPAMQSVHLSYAKYAHSFENIYMNPVIGFIAGMAVEDIGSKNSKVYDGYTGNSYEDKAVVMHAKLPDDKVARIEIVNIFSENKESQDVITFKETSFSVNECLVNGEEMLLSDYIANNNINTQLPLMASFAGAKINASIQSIEDDKSVNLYAPVFKGQKYKFAAPLADDYVKEFEKGVAQVEQGEVAYSCNCILNYLYGELEGKDIGFKGPMTFGEIGYILLNQTLTYLIIE